MALIPLLFLYFVYRMQKYKNGRVKFVEDFMITRSRAMDQAVEAVRRGAKPEIDQVVRQADLPDELERPYRLWVQALVDYYTDLLRSEGDDFESLARSTYSARTSYLLILDHLSAAESKFYAAITPTLAATAGAVEIISAIEKKSRQLRREIAESIFP